MNYRLLMISVLFVFGITACSKTDVPVTSEVPLKISFASVSPLPAFTLEALSKKFPDITFDYVIVNPDTMKTLIESKNVPDIIMDVDRVTIPQNLLNEVQFDMTPLVKKSNLDLNVFEPGLIAHVKSYGTNRELYALPYSRYIYALFYNKTVFDKAGIPYPKDGMNWKSIIELAKKFSNVKPFHGIEPMTNDFGFISLMDQRALSFLNPSTGSVTIQDQKWKNLFEFIRSIYSIPGNGMEYIGNAKAFTDQGSIAMTIGYGLDFILKGAENGQNIDLVSYPTLEENPFIGPGTRTMNLMITASSKNKEKSFDIINFLLSKEMQLQNSRHGIAPVLADQEVMQAFGADIQVVNGKNVSAFFRNKLPDIHAISPFESTAFLTISQFIKRAVDSNESLDLVLNQLNLSIDKNLAIIKNQQAQN